MSETNQIVAPATKGTMATTEAPGTIAGAAIPDSVLEPRDEMIQRMLRDAFTESSPVLANLQLNGGDLLEMSLVMKKAIMEAKKSCTEVADLQELLPFVETYLRLCRQADRVLRLKHDISQTRSARTTRSSKDKK